jgi:hypothetical protein
MKSLIITLSYLFLAVLNAYILPTINDTVKHNIFRNSEHDYTIIMFVTIFFFVLFNIVLIGSLNAYKNKKH